MQNSAWSKGLSDLVKASTHLVGDIKLEPAKGGELFSDTGSESSFESLMSRSRCSTPISSASSASMADGMLRNIFHVSVPSCSRIRFNFSKMN